MIYVISDIHGCYEQFRALLTKINFNKNDTLYLLGDLIDKGPDSIRVLKYVSAQPNIIPLFGNHDYAAYVLLPKLLKNRKPLLSPEWEHILSLWLADGGIETIEEFRKLPKNEQEFLLDYMGNFATVIRLHIKDQFFVLSHSLPGDFDKNPTLEGRPILDILNGRPDFSADWNLKETYVIGHTPTIRILPDHRSDVYKKGSLIDIDCGCVYGGTLAALCLDTGNIDYL